MSEQVCQLEKAECPKCKSDINFKKLGKAFCNCKSEDCDWRCEGHCENKEQDL